MKRFALLLALLGVTSSFVLTSCADTETDVEEIPAVEEIDPEANKSLDKEEGVVKEESSLEEVPAVEEVETTTP